MSRPTTSPAPPVGPLSVRLTVSMPSTIVSLRMGTVKVFVLTVVSVPPAGKLSTPDGGVADPRVP